MEIDPKKIRAYAKIVGCLPLLKDFIGKIEFSEIIDKVCPADPQAYLSYGSVAEILVANRLSAPKPLYKVEDWAEKSGVEDVFGIPADYLNDDKLGRTLEVLAENAPALKGAISLDVARRFKIGLKHIHWDLTTVHFEGEYENQANQDQTIRITYAKDHKNEGKIRKAIKVGIDMANDGRGPIPVFYEALDGNSSGYVETIRNMENLKKHMKLDHIVRINDRGCFSAEILAETKETKFDLISSMKFTSSLEKIARNAIREHTFQRTSFIGENQKRKSPSEQDGYEAFEIDHVITHKKENYPVRLIIVKSDGKVRRDQRSREKHCKRIEKELEELISKAGGAYYTRDRVEKKIKKILSRYHEGRYYEVIVKGRKKLQLHYRIAQERMNEDAVLDGIYLLLTTLQKEEYPLDKVFTLYKEQHYIERANHTLKGTLRIRPVHLQNPKRIEGLVFILWLALICYTLMERIYRMNSNEPKEKKKTTRSIIEHFETYCYSETVIGGKRFLFQNPLNKRQAEIYSRLGLKPPV